MKALTDVKSEINFGPTFEHLTFNFQNEFLKYVDTRVPDLRKGLADKKELTGEFETQLKQALNDFKASVWQK